MAVRGGWLLLLFMLCITIYDLGRSSFQSEERPALSVSTQRGVRIELQDNEGRLDGIHHIIDVRQLMSVIELAELDFPRHLVQELMVFDSISDGKVIRFQIVESSIVSFETGFMPAAQRIALGILLDVNQMSGADWDDLPGVGASLALRIAKNRHVNGDFGSIDGLKRVKGIGSKRIAKWRPFFINAKLLKNSHKIIGQQ